LTSAGVPDRVPAANARRWNFFLCFHRYPALASRSGDIRRLRGLRRRIA
jgi:hypothetical protein